MSFLFAGTSPQGSPWLLLLFLDNCLNKNSFFFGFLTHKDLDADFFVVVIHIYVIYNGANHHQWLSFAQFAQFAFFGGKSV